MGLGFYAESRRNEKATGKSFKILDLKPQFAPKLHERDNLPSHMLVYIPSLRKGVVFMRVVVVKFPKALCGLMRKIFHMDQ